MTLCASARIRTSSFCITMYNRMGFYGGHLAFEVPFFRLRWKENA